MDDKQLQDKQRYVLQLSLIAAMTGSTCDNAKTATLTLCTAVAKQESTFNNPSIVDSIGRLQLVVEPPAMSLDPGLSERVQNVILHIPVEGQATCSLVQVFLDYPEHASVFLKDFKHYANQLTKYHEFRCGAQQLVDDATPHLTWRLLLKQGLSLYQMTKVESSASPAPLSP